MGLGKKDIIKNISSKAQISSLTSKSFLENFLSIISFNSKKRTVKISNFGSFQRFLTPKRIGRNPKTKEEFIISQRSKLSLKPSNKIKTSLN